MEHRVRNTKYKTQTLEAKDIKITTKTKLWVHNTMQELLHPTEVAICACLLRTFNNQSLKSLLKIVSFLCVMSSYVL